MGSVIGPLVSELLDRVRDPGALSVSRVQVRQLLSHAQRAVNSEAQAVLAKLDFPLEARRCVYTLSAFAVPVGSPKVVKAVGVQVEGRSLLPVPWAGLTRSNLYWFRTLGPPRSWTPLGRDLLVIYPAPRTPLTATLTYVPELDELLLDTDELEVPRELEPRLLDLTEALLLTRARLFEQAQASLAKLGVGRAEG